MNILFVTNDISYRLAIGNLLQQEGYSIAFAKNANEGIQLLKNGVNELVISDLDMPGIDGVELCRTARERLNQKNLPFIFLYRHIEDKEILRLSLITDCALFKKGSSIGELINLVQLLTSLDGEKTTTPPIPRTNTAISSNASEAHPDSVSTKGGQASQYHYSARILLIDDEDAFRLLLRDLLVDKGYENVSMASDGSEAIEMLKNEPFDLLLLDIIMPKVSGFGVLHYIHDHLPSTKVVMLTAYTDLKLGIEAKQLGAVDFIAKPIMQKDFFHSLEKALSGKT